MAEEPQVVRGINWRETFPFTHIFRAFRIAIHPSKLALALMAILALYLGGSALDLLWVRSQWAVHGEIELYERLGGGEPFKQAVAARWKRLQEQAADRLTTPNRTRQQALEFAARDPYAACSEMSKAISNDLNSALASAKSNFEAAMKAAANDEQRDLARKNYLEARRAAYARAREGYAFTRQFDGQGPFKAFLDYQARKAHEISMAVLAGNWLGGLGAGAGMPAARELRAAMENELGILAAGGDGVVLGTFKFFTVAPRWAMFNHPLYFILFGALFLCVWSLFGGAIARIAAVHVADEGRKLSIRQGLNFAISKFLSYISAPLIPAIIVLVIGIVMAAGGLLFYIPWVGGPVAGLVFFLALIGGFVITLVILGTAGGFNLMYPTVAVEGSDSFDAISRSFSYVYARPWRMLFYSAVAIAYGALTYLFVRLFIWLTLAMTQFFAGWWFRSENDEGVRAWTAMFPPPDLMALPYVADRLALDGGSAVGSYLIAIWCHLCIAMLGAFAISMYFSANTIIYYLMRKEVDATEMDDVYLEQPEEEFAEAAAPTPAPAGEPAPAAQTSAAEASSGQPASQDKPAPPAEPQKPSDQEQKPQQPPSDA